MNPDKSLPADHGEAKPQTEPEADTIPILEEALDLSEEVSHHEAPLDETDADDVDDDNGIEVDNEFKDIVSSAMASRDEHSSATSHPSEAATDQELSIDLGYAESTEEYVESDDLAEMDEIQTLPLAEMVLDDTQDMLVSAEQKRQIATLEAIVFEGGNPNAPAPRKTIAPEEQAPQGAEKEGPPAAHDMETHPPLAASPTHATPPPVTLPEGKPLPKKSENPFLPQHILDRLNQGKRNLVEEIAQSSAALDASTAILRTHARAERLAKPAYGETKPAQYSFSRDKSAQQKQKMVDDLVEEYLPLIAAELRRRLRKILDE